MSEGALAEAYAGNEIAVCGMAGRFPGASDVEGLWENLCAGRESITRFTDEELRAAGEDEEKLEDPGYVRARPILLDVEHWDADFFGFSPREAEVLDPQQRLFLECAFEALEDAGCDSERHRGAISVFAGASFSNYLVKNLYGNQPVLDAFGHLPATIFNVQDALVTMAGYKLNLRGPCCAVQTFCSTSLVAVHLAAQSLLSYESDVALAGGVTVFVPQRSGYLYEAGSIVSPDGHCRAFDARAAGTVFGSGVGVVVLKRLADALANRDPIRALIRGSAMNNDGSLKVSYAAPGVVGQTEVIAEALGAAGVDPESIGYVEAHGTGTLLGDPAEVSALTRAYRRKTARKGFCALGSVKANVGHLDAAAGVTGLIKAVLCLERERIPPSLNCETPNPQIDFASSPFYVNTALRAWPRGSVPRRAGVSAFGVGGTNAHVVLEEAPRSPAAQASAPSPAAIPQLLVLSARTDTALREARARLAARLRTHPGLALEDVAFTQQVGRRHFPRRFAWLASTRGDALAALEAAEVRLESPAPRKNPAVAFVFRGGRAPRPHAGRDLFRGQETFEAAVRECAVAAQPWLGEDLLARLYPPEGRPSDRGPLSGALGAAAGFALQLGLARMWMAWGVAPEAVAGFGTGELVAACVAQALDLPEALRRAALDGRSGTEEAPGRRSQAREPRIPLVSGALGDKAVLAALEAFREPLVLELDYLQGLPDADTDGEEGGGLLAPSLESLGRLWKAGVQPDWDAVHGSRRPRRVHLPTYPFERQRHWVDPLPPESAPVAAEPEKAPDPVRWLYEPVWKAGLASVRPPETITGRFLVFAGRGGFAPAVVDHLREQGAEVVVVEAGAAYAFDPPAGCRLDPARPEDYARLAADLERGGSWPDRIVHTWSADSGPIPPSAAPVAPADERGFLSVLYLLQAFAERREGPDPVEVVIVSSGLNDVVGREALCPEKAPLLALATVANQELHPLVCRVVDLEAGEGEIPQAARAVVRELSSPHREPLVAYRGGRRWTRVFEPLGGERAEGPIPHVRPGGAYLITGGLGNVGFVLALVLTRAAKVRLVLVGRSELPPRAEWSTWLAGRSPHDPTSVRIKRVMALEAAGAEVTVAVADVADPAQMEVVIASALERFSRIDGVVHAAGLLGKDDFRPITGLDRLAWQRMSAAKIGGLLVLDRLLERSRPDFWLLTSSLSTVLGGLGYAAYAGANAFLDQFALARNREEGERWVSVDLDQWQFGLPAGGGSAGVAITPPEGVALFEHLLRGSASGQVVVSTTPLAPRLARSVDLQPVAESVAAAPVRPRPALAAAYLAPRDAPERLVAGIFEELLGVGPVGAHDDFFELGGHSLFAARVLSRLREAFKVSLPLSAFFEAPTPAGLAGRVAAGRLVREAAAEPTTPVGERVEIEI